MHQLASELVGAQPHIASAASPRIDSADRDGPSTGAPGELVNEASPGDHTGSGDALRLRAEQAVLVRVAGAAAAGTDLMGMCCLVAKEACGWVWASTGAVFRTDSAAPTTIGYWSDSSTDDDGSLARVGPDIAIRVSSISEPVGANGAVGAPILGPDGVWGAIVVSGAARPSDADEAALRLMGFAQLVGMLLVGASDRALLGTRAPDALTGLARRQAFDEVFVREVTRAKRHGYPTSLAVLDIDGYSGISERFGSTGGDRALLRVARCLRDAAREDDLIARVGRDQFAWLLPFCTPAGADGAAERLRAAVAGRSDPDLEMITISVGVCDLARGHDPGQLFALAHAACANARERGGNGVHHYRLSVPEPGAENADVVRAAEPTRPATVYELARAVDVKDPSTHGHSRRVADLSGLLADKLGWTSSRVRLIREAGLLYDVGKSCIPDDILLKSDVLTATEFELVRTHVTVGAQIVEDVLTTEQVDWVRHHHERFDGRGYPAGMAGTLIPEGARILAVADSWDVMTTGRPYKTALGPEQALGECQRMAGSQFCPDVVSALGQLWKDGMLSVGQRSLG
jgi:diguanylate cyclase (GGDEF)-like protein